MNREQLLARLDKAWAALGESYAGLTEAEMTTPGVAGDWSVKDMLAHVATWEEEALKYLHWCSREADRPATPATAA